MATKTAFVLRLTNPAGESRDIPVKPSLAIRAEERAGAPLWTRVGEGYTGAMARFGWEVGREEGFIPASVDFDDFVDADPGWEIDVLHTPAAIPADVDATTPEEAEALAGEA